MTVYYFLDASAGVSDFTKTQNWDRWNLFVPVDSTREPKIGDVAVHINWGDVDQVGEITPFLKWEKWPFKLPNKFYHLVIKTIFLDE